MADQGQALAGDLPTADLGVCGACELQDVAPVGTWPGRKATCLAARCMVERQYIGMGSNMGWLDEVGERMGNDGKLADRDGMEACAGGANVCCWQQSRMAEDQDGVKSQPTPGHLYQVSDGTKKLSALGTLGSRSFLILPYIVRSYRILSGLAAAKDIMSLHVVRAGEIPN